MAVNILLVDDNATQASTRKAILERVGHSVQVTENGQAALTFLGTEAAYAVSLVITDHLMPVMNGPEFVTRLRQTGYQLPILVLSGYADAEDDYESLDVVFRLKPFAPDQLIALTQYLIAAAERRSA